MEPHKQKSKKATFLFPDSQNQPSQQNKKNKGKSSTKPASEETKAPATASLPVPGPAIELPVETLLKMAQDYMEALNITDAQQILERALAKYPENVNVLDTLGELLFSLGEVERALTVLMVFWLYIRPQIIVAQKISGVGSERKWPQIFEHCRILRRHGLCPCIH